MTMYLVSHSHVVRYWYDLLGEWLPNIHNRCLTLVCTSTNPSTCSIVLKSDWETRLQSQLHIICLAIAVNQTSSIECCLLHCNPICPHACRNVSHLFTKLVHTAKQLSKSFTPQEHAAAVWVITHTNIHVQQSSEQLSTWHSGGLHPSYFPAHMRGTGSKEDVFRVCTLLDDSVKDIFNAVSSSSMDTCCERTNTFSSKIKFQDHIDGRLTMLIRASGYQINETTCMEDLVLDMYFTPHKVAEGGDQLRSNLAVFAQSFGENFLMPYLHWLKAHAKAEGIVPHVCFLSIHSPFLSSNFM